MIFRICDSNQCYVGSETILHIVTTLAFVILILKCIGNTASERWRIKDSHGGGTKGTTDRAPYLDAAIEEDIQDWLHMQAHWEPPLYSGVGVQVKRDEPDTDIAVLSTFTFESRPSSPLQETKELAESPKKQQGQSWIPPAKRHKKSNASSTNDVVTQALKNSIDNSNQDGSLATIARSSHSRLSSEKASATPTSYQSLSVAKNHVLPSISHKGIPKLQRAPMRSRIRVPSPPLRSMATTRPSHPAPATKKGYPTVESKTGNSTQISSSLKSHVLAFSAPKAHSSPPTESGLVASIVDSYDGSAMNGPPRKLVLESYKHTKDYDVKSKRLPHPYLKSRSSLVHPLCRSTSGAIHFAKRNQSKTKLASPSSPLSPAYNPSSNTSAHQQETEFVDIGASGRLYPEAFVQEINFVIPCSPNSITIDNNRPIVPRKNFAGHIASLISNQYDAFVQEYESFRSKNLACHQLGTSQTPSNTIIWPQSRTNMVAAPLVASSNETASAQIEVAQALEDANGRAQADGILPVGTNIDLERPPGDSTGTHHVKRHAKQALNIYIQESDCSCGRHSRRNANFQEAGKRQYRQTMPLTPTKFSHRLTASNLMVGHHLQSGACGTMVESPSYASRAHKCNNYKLHEQGSIHPRTPSLQAPLMVTGRKVEGDGSDSPFYFSHCDICKTYPRYKNI